MKLASLCVMWTMLLSLSAARADELTILSFPSPAGISWKSPSRLAWSALWNFIVPSPYELKHSIGHASVRLQCDGGDDWTGMTEVGDGSDHAVLQEGAGLGVFFETFEGRLQTADEVRADYAERVGDDQARYVNFTIRPDTCRRLTTYLREFRESGDEKRYGLHLRPLHHEGSGCTAFAASFLEVAGLMTPELEKAWSKTRRVPEEFIGDPAHGVSLWSLLFSGDASRWARVDEPGRELQFWDPDALFRWIGKQRDYGQSGVSFDATGVATPQGPIWVSNP